MCFGFSFFDFFLNVYAHLNLKVREHVKGYSNKGHAWNLTYVLLYITNVK